MIFYNVSIQISIGKEAEWFYWMQTEHIPEMLATGCFQSARLCRLLQMEDVETATYSVQYALTEIMDYDAYIQNHAEAMRTKGLARFGGAMTAFRTLMEESFFRDQT